MMGRRPSVAAAASLACAALALWASFGALTFLDADNGAVPVSYVGLLPPLWWLALLAACLRPRRDHRATVGADRRAAVAVGRRSSALAALSNAAIGVDLDR